jgi:hypothetical protein
MNRVIEKLDQSLFPEKLRRYITFRLATVFVLVVVFGSSVLDMLNGPESLPNAAKQIRWSPKLIYSPTVLILNALVSVFGFWLIYRTREKKQYYRFRVLFYGMLLGGLITEVLDSLLLPRR